MQEKHIEVLLWQAFPLTLNHVLSETEADICTWKGKKKEKWTPALMRWAKPDKTLCYLQQVSKCAAAHVIACEPVLAGNIFSMQPQEVDGDNKERKTLEWRSWLRIYIHRPVFCLLRSRWQSYFDLVLCTITSSWSLSVLTVLFMFSLFTLHPVITSICSLGVFLLSPLMIAWGGKCLIFCHLNTKYSNCGYWCQSTLVLSFLAVCGHVCGRLC